MLGAGLFARCESRGFTFSGKAHEEQSSHRREACIVEANLARTCAEVAETGGPVRMEAEALLQLAYPPIWPTTAPASRRS